MSASSTARTGLADNKKSSTIKVQFRTFTSNLTDRWTKTINFIPLFSLLPPFVYITIRRQFVTNPSPGRVFLQRIYRMCLMSLGWSIHEQRQRRPGSTTCMHKKTEAKWKWFSECVEMYRATTGWFSASQSSPRSAGLRSRCTFKSAVVVNYL